MSKRLVCIFPSSPFLQLVDWQGANCQFILKSGEAKSGKIGALEGDKLELQVSTKISLYFSEAELSEIWLDVSFGY